MGNKQLALERLLEDEIISETDYGNQLKDLTSWHATRKNNLEGFNYVKMHLPCHYQDHIKRFGHLEGFSTDVRELAHKSLKDRYRKSNKLNPFS